MIKYVDYTHCIPDGLPRREIENMETIETLKKAVERGYFTLEDVDALGNQARLIDSCWEAESEKGFQRIETEVAHDNPSDLKSQAQDIGLWVDYVSPHGKMVCFRFTIPPAEGIQLNYQGLGYNPEDFHLYSPFLPQARPGTRQRAHRRRGTRITRSTK